MTAKVISLFPGRGNLANKRAKKLIQTKNLFEHCEEQLFALLVVAIFELLQNLFFPD